MKKPASESRRTWLKQSALTAAAAALPLLTRPSFADSNTTGKATKAAVHYQDRPVEGKMCGMCRYFIPPGGTAGRGMMGEPMGPGMMNEAGACQVVQGPISPMGYCVLYTPV
ncbi:MAG TPA: hypothetical protein VNE82_02290 [Candidatus Binataceae bacterium]|nr:hypothetical protein [Candidatus Binataceae bacterium]